jgi:hypothetical protein
MLKTSRTFHEEDDDDGPVVVAGVEADIAVAGACTGVDVKEDGTGGKLYSN